MKIEIDQEKCIGCGSCSAVCPDVFELNEDNKAVAKDTENKDCVKEAVEACPVEAIKVEE